MNKLEIDKKTKAMAQALREHHDATGENLERSCRMFLMDAIRETEDEAKAIAYDLVARIGAKRKES